MLYQLILILLAIGYAYWFQRRWRKLHMLQKLGYPVPPVSFIGGNLFDLIGDKGPENQYKWMEKYAEPMGNKGGKILGWYRGCTPAIYVTDPDFIKQVLIKESEVFTDRPMIDRTDNIPHLLLLRGAQWKRVRSTLSPTFSTAKLKRTSLIMSGAVQTMINVIWSKIECGLETNYHDLFQALTLDVIGQSSLAMTVNCQLNESDQMLEMVKRSLNQQVDTTAIVAAFFPELETLMATLFRNDRKRTNDLILAWCQEVLDKRRSIPIEERGPAMDSLQLMINAAEGKDGTKKLTDDEITGNAFIFVLAGYETTATCLSFTAYLLATHSDVQEKLRDEIDEAFNDSSLLNESNKDAEWMEAFTRKVQSLEYLDCVLNESMRVYPPVALHLGRHTNATTTVLGRTVPEGTAVLVPIWYLHHDPNIWHDPWTFIPERFSKENRGSIPECSFLPFGDGPRKCIGWRFAMLEAKITLAYLLKHFILQPCEKTPAKMGYRWKGLTLAPANDQVVVKTISRIAARH